MMTDSTDPNDCGGKAELLELLMGATQDGVIDWDLRANQVEYNPRWRHLLGFDDSQLSLDRSAPRFWLELVHPEERAAVVSQLGDHLERGWPFSPTIRMRHGAGGYRHLLCRGTSSRDAEERPLRMVIVFSDIDERIREESRGRALVSALPDTLFRVGADGTINGLRRGCEREGSPFAALREGMTLADSFGDVRLRARLEAALFGDVSAEAHSAKTLRVTTSVGEHQIHHEVRIVRSSEDETVCIVRDVTGQRELEERLLESQKLGAIGQLAAGVAHEINTPMQFIGDNLHFTTSAVGDLIALCEQLKAAVEEAEHAALGELRLQQLARAVTDADFEYVREALPAAIERSLDGVERVTKIVRAMKSFAHPGGDQLAPTDLKALIESTVMVATNEWRYVADVQLELDPNLPPVPCIAGELNQVVLNLLVNAAHAIADVVGATGGKGQITVKASSDATHAEIRVIDSGTGIPEHARPKVFEPFFTTKEVGKGTGQGLSLAYNCIVKRHRGSINFETELGTGTTFVIRLPLVNAALRSSVALTPFPR
jgi:PAS domain S-box-containing protein